MPAEHAARLGSKDALLQLASEAVRVAAQSPFLERAVGRAKAVLCCIYLPDAGPSATGDCWPALLKGNVLLTCRLIQVACVSLHTLGH
jgi:hypothetical protein